MDDKKNGPIPILTYRCSRTADDMMDAVLLVLSWTLFVPPAHDVNVQTMPDMRTCLEQARLVAETVAGLEERGLEAKLVARCITVPTHLGT
jgi:hypothetical protein